MSINGSTLKNVQTFPYLGSVLSTKADIEAETLHRLKAASCAFGRLRERVFAERSLRKDTKLLVYKAVVLPSLLYGSETWTTYRRHLNVLEKYHQRCLRRILGVTWQDRRTNCSVLDEAQCTSIEAMIIVNQLRWTGHVVRLMDSHLPKQILFGELGSGTRAQGGQRKRFKDNLKANFKVCHIGLTTWEDLARDRPRWRHAVRESVALFEEERRQKAEEKRQRHKEREVAPALSQQAPYICPACGKACHSRMGLFSHQRVHKTRS